MHIRKTDNCQFCIINSIKPELVAYTPLGSVHVNCVYDGFRKNGCKNRRNLYAKFSKIGADHNNLDHFFEKSAQFFTIFY